MKIFNDMLIHLEDLINKAEEGAPTSEGIKIPPRYLQLPPAEENGKGRYVLQAHWRGRSVHWDLRLELPSFLIGYTILDNPKIEEAPTEQNVKSVMENLDFKFKPIPGMEGKKCRIAEKARQPKDWLLWKEEYGECGLIKFDELYKQDIGVLYTVEETTEFSDLVEADLQKYIKQIGSRWCVVRHSPPHEIIHCYSGTGAHDKARKLLGAIQASKHRRMMAKMSTGTVYSVEPGGVGATRFKPGVLFIADKGKVTFGAQKVWYNEYFLESEGKGGKFSFNKLRVNV
ncbi:MAG: hypothetical protein KJ888_20850, partial [Gammaproteobacteria bacterium]|nr:hypothetical protein [Gammaproteobacteria bacterium]